MLPVPEFATLVLDPSHFFGEFCGLHDARIVGLFWRIERAELLIRMDAIYGGMLQPDEFPEVDRAEILAKQVRDVVLDLHPEVFDGQPWIMDTTATPGEDGRGVKIRVACATGSISFICDEVWFCPEQKD